MCFMFSLLYCFWSCIPWFYYNTPEEHISTRIAASTRQSARSRNRNATERRVILQQCRVHMPTTSSTQNAPQTVSAVVSSRERSPTPRRLSAIEAQESRVHMPTTSPTLYVPQTVSAVVSSRERSPTPRPVSAMHAFQSITYLINWTSEIERVTLHRVEVATKFLQLYDTERVLTKRLHVSFVGEDGLDGGGITKEFLMTTWTEVFNSFFTGNDYAVPHLPLHRTRQDEKKFIQIGRLLCHTIGLLHLLPARLCRITLLQLAFGEDEISDEVLLSDFLMYLCYDERELIQRALEDFDSISTTDKGQLLNVYAVYDMQRMPKKASFKEDILCIAREVLMVKPARFVRNMRKGISDAYATQFFSQLTMDKINDMYVKLRPTSTSVAARIVAENERGMGPKQVDTLRMFRSVVREMNREELADFLAYVTGSQLMPQDDIRVCFFQATLGLSRLPKVHLCGTLVELSSSYDSRDEMRRDWFSLMRNMSAYRTTML